MARKKAIVEEVEKAKFDKAESKEPYVDKEAEIRKKLLAENPNLRIPR